MGVQRDDAARDADLWTNRITYLQPEFAFSRFIESYSAFVTVSCAIAQCDSVWPLEERNRGCPNGSTCSEQLEDHGKLSLLETEGSWPTEVNSPVEGCGISLGGRAVARGPPSGHRLLMMCMSVSNLELLSILSESYERRDVALTSGHQFWQQLRLTLADVEGVWVRLTAAHIQELVVATILDRRSDVEIGLEPRGEHHDVSPWLYPYTPSVDRWIAYVDDFVWKRASSCHSDLIDMAGGCVVPVLDEVVVSRRRPLRTASGPIFQMSGPLPRVPTKRKHGLVEGSVIGGREKRGRVVCSAGAIDNTSCGEYRGSRTPGVGIARCTVFCAGVGELAPESSGYSVRGKWDVMESKHPNCLVCGKGSGRCGGCGGGEVGCVESSAAGSSRFGMVPCELGSAGEA